MENNATNNRIALGLTAVIFSMLIAVVGLILGVIGICKYEKKTPGRVLSIAAVIIALVNSVFGIILATLINM